MIESTLHQACCVILVRTKFDGNLGSVARAMLNFGISELRLVNPLANPCSHEARSMATHGAMLLEKSQTFQSLTDAITDCVWTGCTSARTGGLFRKQNVVELQHGIQKARETSDRGRIALVFGPEDHGLTNEEISICNYVLTIPANADYPVLNLAQAVVITLYEWYLSNGLNPTKHEAVQLASAYQTQCMFEHLEAALRAIHFVWGEKGPSVFHAIRHLLGRAQITETENKLLHGLARQISWYVNQKDNSKKMPPGSLEA